MLECCCFPIRYLAMEFLFFCFFILFPSAEAQVKPSLSTTMPRFQHRRPHSLSGLSSQFSEVSRARCSRAGGANFRNPEQRAHSHTHTHTPEVWWSIFGANILIRVANSVVRLLAVAAEATGCIRRCRCRNQIFDYIPTGLLVSWLCFQPRDTRGTYFPRKRVIAFCRVLRPDDPTIVVPGCVSRRRVFQE